MKVLIVDDSSVMRRIVTRTLRQAGYTELALVEAANGLEAFEASRRRRCRARWGENFAEMLSIGISLLNHDDTPHVRLYETCPPGELPAADVLELAKGLGRRLDLAVSIAGYGSGNLSIVRRP